MEKKTITLLASAVICFGVFAVAYAPYGWAPNLGLTFGYYGEFNQMNRAIQKNEKLRVADFGQHKDAYLEGFWISATTEDGREFTLDVSDSERIRTPREEAEGVIVFTGGYMNGIAIPFDSPFWESYGGDSPKNTEALLSDMDFFLARFEALQSAPSKIEFIESLDLIRIKYEEENES